MSIEAIVFDFDGLILDTELPIYTSWCTAFEAHGAAPPTIEEWSAEIGTAGAIDIEAWLVERASVEVDLDAMHGARRVHCAGLLEVEVVRPGVEAWLDEADAAGLGLAIASSSDSEWVVGHLERLGLRDRFAYVVTAGAGGLPGKPAPDTYLAACALLGVAPPRAIAVEDSPNGIAAAKAAGLHCVTVPHVLTETLDLSAADVRLTSLASSTITAVVAQL